MGLYFFTTTTEVVKERLIPRYLTFTADIAGGVVHVFGYEDMHVRGNALVCPRGSISVERGCDALAPSALFVSAVLASPVPVLSRLSAALVGTLFLMVLNLIRIISLFLTGVHWHAAFDVMHLDVWQSAFIFLAILFWAGWAAWQTKRRRVRRAESHAKS